MAKLKNIRSTLQSVAPRLGYAEGDTKAADKKRNRLNAGRAWYQTQEWKRLRLQVFVRDRFKCQRSGVTVSGKYPAPDSPVANHKIPHRGDPELFWDINNLETVSKAVHDGLIQSEEQAQPRGIWD